MFFKTIFLRTCRLGLFFCCFSACHVKAVTPTGTAEKLQGTTFPVTAEVHNPPISPDQGESSSPVHRPEGKATIFQHVTPSAPSEESVPSSGHSLEFERITSGNEPTSTDYSWRSSRGGNNDVDRGADRRVINLEALDNLQKMVPQDKTHNPRDDEPLKSCFYTCLGGCFCFISFLFLPRFR